MSARSFVGRITFVASLLLAVQLPGAPAPGGRRAATSFRPGVVLVKLHNGASADSAQLLFRAHGAASTKRFKRPRSVAASAVDRWWRVNLTPGQDARAALHELLANPMVEAAELDARISIASIPDDPGFPQLWGLHNTGQTGGTPDADVDAPEAWNIETGAGVMVGVIDTGIDYTHPDLAANIWTNPLEIPGNGIDDDDNGYVDDVHGYDFANRDGDPMDDHGHGTHVAGTIAAVANNGIGVAGVSWHAKVMALKFLDANGNGWASDAVDALTYATDMGAKITNNSWGGGEYSTALRDAIASANSAGAVFVAAAGNYSSNNDTTPFYPADYEGPNVIAVAATDASDTLAAFSNFGRSTVHLAAPGVNIYSTVPAVGAACCSSPTRYGTLSGTSMATPHVSGAAALLLSHYPGLTPAQVRQRLAFSGDPVPALAATTLSGRRLNLVGMLEQDDIPPDATADFRVLTHSSRSVRLAWTATGDDGSGGLAATYELRYSTAPVTAANFGAATLAPSLPRPAVPGVTETFTITGLSFNTRYYFALRVLDNAGNASPLATATAQTDGAVTVFQDDMEHGLAGWIIYGSDGVGGPALWHLSPHRFHTPGNALYYGREATLTYDTGAANYGVIESPSIDLTNRTGTWLSFWHFMEKEATPSYDVGRVFVSDDGATWIEVTSFTASTPPAMTEVSLDLSAYDGRVIRLRFELNTGDAVLNSYEGWVIDDVMVSANATGAPPVANAGPDRTVEAGGPLTLDGWASYDPDGDPITYEWKNAAGAIVGTSPVVFLTAPASTTTYTLRVADNHGNSATDSVTITVTDTTPPSAHVVSPGAGEAITRARPYTIQWTAADNAALAGFDVAFSADGGATFAPLPGCTGLAGGARSCLWSSPTPATTQGRLRVTVRDAAGNSSLDVAAFAIVEPLIVVTVANTPTAWDIGSSRRISWTHNLAPGSEVNLEVARDGVWKTIASAVANATTTDGFYDWLVTGPTTPTGRIRISSSTNPANFDVNDADIWINSPVFLLKDIVSGPNSSSPQRLVNVFGKTVFAATDPVLGTEPWRTDGTAAGTVMLRDITAGTFSSDPLSFKTIGRTTYFVASDNSGGELWKTDGTGPGTVLVKDIFPGSLSSAPSSLTEFGGLLYFSATGSSGTGRELWRSDGTAAGTVMVRDLWPGASSSAPANFTDVDGVLYFTANDALFGTELWKTDGTPEGTVLVGDVSPGPNSSNPSSLTNVNGTLFFTATSGGPEGPQLWRTDVVPGVLMRLTFTPGGSPQNLTSLNGVLYFTYTDPATGNELWKSDGTPWGTVLVKDITPSGSSSPAALTVAGNTLFFTASDVPTGRELWKSDGTASSTVLVKDINQGPASSAPAWLTWGGDVLLFQATDYRGSELWESDGTAAGTVLAQELYAGPNSSGPAELTVGGHRLTFVATHPTMGREPWVMTRPVNLAPAARAGADRVVPTGSLITLDGSASWDGDDDALTYEWLNANGTVMGTTPIVALSPVFGVGTYSFTLRIKDGHGGETSDSVKVTVDGFPVANAGPDQTVEAGPSVRLDGSASSDPDGDPITFAWRNSSGSLLGTSAVINTSLPVGTSTLTLTVTDYKGAATSDSVVVTVNDTTPPAVNVTAPAEGSALYSSVPLPVQWTAADNGVLTAFDLSFSTDGGATFSPVPGCVGLSGSARSCSWASPGPVTSQGRIRVTARDSRGNQAFDDNTYTMIAPLLVVTSPNTAATWPIGSTQNITWAHNFGASATFRVELSVNGGSTWKTLASAALSVGASAGSLDWPVVKPHSPNARVRVSWTANVATSDVSDVDFTIGAPAYRVKNIFASGSSSPSLLVNVGGQLFFAATDGFTGTELWKSDGTDAGTVLVKDITPGGSTTFDPPVVLNGILYFVVNVNTLWRSDGTAVGTRAVGAPGSTVTGLTVSGGKLFFNGCDTSLGCELWSSNGSTITRVKDLWPGSGSSSPGNLTDYNGRLLFVANDGTNGMELWASDGTAAGTFLVKDINPGTPSSSPTVFRTLNGALFFGATTAAQGRELWKTDGTAGGTVLVANSTESYASTFIETSVSAGNLLFYRAYPQAPCCLYDQELWRSDGTAAGTFRTKDIRPGDSGSYPDWLADLGGKVYFQADDGTGAQLWRSDGTASGTVPFKTIAPAVGSVPALLRNVKGTLFFSAIDSFGAELWETDGTSVGTSLTQDINPGSASSSPDRLTVAGHRLFFVATNGTDRELWALPLAINEPPVANAGADRTIEAGAQATLTGTASDPDGDTLTYEWKDEGGTVVGTTPTITVVPAVGSHSYTLTVDDGHGGTANDGVLVTVQDTTSPVVALTAPRGVTVPTGTPLTVQWTASDNALARFDVSFSGDAGATFTPIAECSALDGAARSCVWPSPGPRSAAARIRVTARDGSGNTASDEAPFVINRAPVAGAATPAPAFRNQAVAFDGATSNDPDGDPLTYQWDFGDGATATGSSPTHAFTALGSHMVTLVVNDGITGSSPVTVTVAITNQAPTANAGGPYTAVRNQAIAFDGSASADADGDALTYQWDFGDGAIATGANPTHAFTTLGTHTVTLVVIDGHDTSAPATATVTITNQAPTANAGGPYAAVRNQAITFDGSASADADGDALTYQWDFGDGATATGASPTHAFTTLGAHTVTLVVSDGHDTSAPATATVTITNQTPTATAGGPYTAVRNQSIAFDGSASADADGDALTYQWDFGDGATATGASPTHAFTTLGAHTVTLVVSDGHDTSAPATATVTITNQTPTATAGGPYTAVRNHSITFDGSASADADGDALTYQWDFGDGATATGASPSHPFSTLDAHIVTLVVSDGHDSSAPATATVTITNQTPTAHAGGPYTAVRNQVVSFDSGASADADGDALTYQWDFGDGVTPTGASPTHAFSTLGAHTITLVVSDGHDTSAPATATVTITNQAPTANAAGPYTAVRNQSIAFDGSGSADPDSDALTYQWDFGGGAMGTGRNPTHAFSTLGAHTITLVVSDGHDTSAPGTTMVTITNQAPIAAAGPDQTIELGSSATLSGATSSDPDQDPLTYEWRDGTGAVVGTSAAVTLSLPLGTQTFTLTVRDGQGGVGSDSAGVTVRDTTPPAVAVTAPQAVQLLTGVPALVQWTAADNGALAAFDVAFSSDGGLGYSPIPGCTGLGGAVRSCTWTSPGPATAQGRVRVTGRDASGNASVATSSFTIANPALTVTSPNTAVNWAVGSSQLVTWTSNVGPEAAVRVELSRDGGGTWSTLASSAPNTGAFAWTVTSPNATTARVRVTWTGGAGAADTSDANFTIAAPVVTVTVPNTRVTWTIGSVRAITWSHNLGTSASMRIEVSRNGGSTWTVVAASVPNGGAASGTFNWTVTGPATNQGRIRVSWTANTAINDRSDANFVIQ